MSIILTSKLNSPLLNLSYSAHENYFDRNSINSQKYVDEVHGPFKVHNNIRAEMRTRPNFRPCAALSSYAGQEAGDAGSFAAVRYYQNSFAKRRDEIMTDIAKNGE